MSKLRHREVKWLLFSHNSVTELVFIPRVSRPFYYALILSKSYKVPFQFSVHLRIVLQPCLLGKVSEKASSFSKSGGGRFNQLPVHSAPASSLVYSVRKKQVHHGRGLHCSLHASLALLWLKPAWPASAPGPKFFFFLVLPSCLYLILLPWFMTCLILLNYQIPSLQGANRRLFTLTSLILPALLNSASLTGIGKCDHLWLCANCWGFLQPLILSLKEVDWRGRGLEKEEGESGLLGFLIFRNWGKIHTPESSHFKRNKFNVWPPPLSSYKAFSSNKTFS